MEEGLSSYNAFCSQLHEGDILKNLNPSNNWGAFLMVVGKSSIALGEHSTYSVLLVGLEDNGEGYTGNGNSIFLTPDKLRHTEYLRYVGKGKYTLSPVVSDIEIDERMMNMSNRLNVKKWEGRRPRTKRYDACGNPIIKKMSNNK